MWASGAWRRRHRDTGRGYCGRIEVAVHNVADFDRRLGQIDSAIKEAAKRGKTNTALSAIEGQRKARASLVDKRNHEAGALAALKAERRISSRQSPANRNGSRAH